MQALAFGLAGLLLTLVGVLATIVLTTRHRLRDVERHLDGAQERAHRLGRELAEAAHSRVLEGELVVVNTPKPDDQSVRGVVNRELESGLLVLTAAVYLERDRARGRDTVREVPVGDVVVAGPKLGGFVQVLYAGPGQES